MKVAQCHTTEVCKGGSEVAGGRRSGEMTDTAERVSGTRQRGMHRVQVKDWISSEGGRKEGELHGRSEIDALRGDGLPCVLVQYREKGWMHLNFCLSLSL